MESQKVFSLGRPFCLFFFVILCLLLVGGQAALPVAAEPGLIQSLYESGPFVNSPMSGAGGADESILQTDLFGMNTLGFGHQVAAGFRVADDFTVVDANGWDVESITFYAYQTGSTTASTITAVNYRVWNGSPADPGSQIVFGNTTTNRLTGSTWTNAYRVTEATSGSAIDRPVMTVVASAGFHLAPGTYWLDWQVDGSLASGPWAVPITMWGESSTGNGLQYDPTSTSWGEVLDSGTGTPQGFPFVIHGVPPHDLFANPRTVSNLPYLDRVRTTSATTSPDDPIYPCPFVPNQGQKSVWYRYTTSATTPIVAHTKNSNYDTMLAVWRGTPGSLTNVACNDDSGGNLQSYLTFTARAGTTYYLQVSAYGMGGGGDLALSVIEGDQWMARGPERPSPTINELTIDTTAPNTVYAATTEGVYKSTNGGSSWSPRLDGLGTFGGLEVTNLVISPSSAQTVYISTWGDGIYKSTDGGSNWSLLRSLPDAIYGTAVQLIDGEWVHQIGPAPYTRLADGLPLAESFAGAEEGVDTAVMDTAVRGTGADFKQQLDLSLPLLETDDESFRVPIAIQWVPARYLAIHPTDANRLIVAVSGRGFYLTQDGGDSWAELDMPGATLSSGRAIAFSASSPNIAYASRGDWGANGGIFRSTNGGLNWTMVAGNAMVTDVVSQFAVHPTTPNTVLAATVGQGVMKTTDGGQNWNPSNNGLTETNLLNIEISRLNPNIVFATGIYYIWKSVDGGDNWVEADAAFSDLNVSGLALHPTDTAVAYAGAQQFYWGPFYYGGGVFKTVDGGSTFVRHISGMQNTYVLDMEADPNNPMIVYAGTWGSGMFRSTDGGKTWAQANKGLSLPFVYALKATNGPGGTVLYAGTFYSGAALFVSYNQGISWEPLPITDLPPLAQAMFDVESRTGNYDRLAIATADGIYVSNNAGVNWTRGQLNGNPTENIILDIERVPGVTNRLVAATYGDGVYYASDVNGLNWSAATGEPSTLVFGLSNAPDVAQATHVYAANAGVSAFTGGTAVAGLSRSVDGGVTWQAVNDPALVGLSFRAVDHALEGTGDIFAGSVGQGMWVSPDYSGRWFHMNQGFTPTRVRSVDANFAAPDKVFVGTDGQGAWWFHMVNSPAFHTVYLPATLKP